MNIVEFALKFKDAASPALLKFGQAANSTFKNAGEFANNLAGRNRVLGMSYSELQKQIRQVEDTVRNSTIPSQIRAAQRELASLQKQASSHPGGMGGGGKMSAKDGGGFNPMSLVKGGLIIKAGMEIADFLGDAINAGMERQKIQTSFSVLTGSKEAGDKLTKDLVDLQKQTGLGSEVFKNAQTMMGFGIDNSDVVNNLKMLGDISMGDKQKLDSLTLAFSQMSSAGKLMGQDLLQMVNAGFNPLEQMSQTTGKSIATLRDEMSKGNISSAMVTQAFRDATSEGGKFNNMLAQIAETPAGKMAQMQGQWEEFKVAAGGAMQPLVMQALQLAQELMPIAADIMPYIKSAADAISNVIQFLVPIIKDIFSPAVEMIKKLTSDTSGWSDYITTIKNLISEHIAPLFKKVAGSVFEMVGKIAEFYQKSELIKGIFKFIAWVVGKIADVIGVVVDALTWVFNNVVMPIIEVVEKAYRLIAGENSQKMGAKSATKRKFDASKNEQTNTELLNDIAKNTKENSQLSSENAKSAISGGPKVINITVSKFLDELNIITNNLSESSSEVERTFTELFSRLLAQGATNAK